ncbi:MAG: T9SS type A sorting domain-containing protein, partial [Tannerella sp.]|nr:T9SS type A sorting domain-containing protein [Tannerella sp.]
LLPPMPSVNSGFVASGQTITLSAADGAVIRYTLDGSDPQTSATAQNYSGSTSFRTPAAGSLLVKAYAQLAEKVSTTSSMLWLPKETLYWGTPSNFNRPLFGLCVSLALNGEQYGLKITEEETVRRMSPVKDLAHWVRTYGTVNNGHEYINKIAKQNDMKVMQGIYISENPTHVATQMEGLRQILEMGPDVPDLISIGNELSLNQKVSTATFLGAIEQVRALLKSKSLVIPVGSVDIAGATLRHAIIDRLDFIGVDIYAGTWDNTPESQMVDVTKKMYADEVASYEPKLVLITEVGTPYSGGNYVPTGASATQTPSETKARNYLDAMITWSHSDGIPLMWFAAYDEKIKSVEGHKIEEFFGLMDGNLQVHPFFKPPLSNSVVASPEKTVLQVRPNPVKESFSVETPEGTKVTVFDMTGKLVLEQNYNGVSVNLSALADGAYIVNVGKSSCKIIKRK